MGIYNFNSVNKSPGNLKDQSQPPRINIHRTLPVENNPKQLPLTDTPSKSPAAFKFEDDLNINTPEFVIERINRGFFTFDRSLKNYFSGIRVPTVDNIKIANVRVSGGEKATLVWLQELARGRIVLPIIAISRTGAEYNPAKFSYPYYPMRKSYNNTGDRIIYTYRPVPYIINYDISIWAEFKHDAEIILDQIMTRFNPLAEMRIQDEFLTGCVQMKMNSYSDSSDKEVDAETRPNIRYDVGISLEGWLPLPEKSMPTILGSVTTLREDVTNEYFGKLEKPIVTRRG